MRHHPANQDPLRKAPRPQGTSKWALLTDPNEIRKYVPSLSKERLKSASSVGEIFRFRVPEFYAQHVLTGAADDPLIDIVLPIREELEDGEELWDSTPSLYRASESPFWVQKYEYQGLLRVTTFCSGLCRFCYLKKKNSAPSVMRERDVDLVFDDLEQNGHSLREIILSGGDPLSAPPSTLLAIGRRMERLRLLFDEDTPHITIHTREPVWDPTRLLQDRQLWPAIQRLKPKTIMINVLHPREVTLQFLEVCQQLAEACGSNNRPLLLSQHPLFRGVNDSVETLEKLYRRLMNATPPIMPYYLVHPFYNGTLRRHQMPLKESQRIYAELIRRPGCMVPRLVVPTPWGKCVVGPHQVLEKIDGAYTLRTKDGRPVRVNWA